MTERIIAQRLGIGLPQVQGTVRLLREGATIPFISRYRKEATGSLDELQVGAIKEQLDRLTELEARRQTVLTTIEGQGKLTGELRKRIEECWNAVELEDIYLPYKPKRRTRATAARERGLEPLADIVMAQRAHDLLHQAQRFVTAEVPTPEEAIAGACDIVAERISEDEQARNTVRRTMGREGAVHSKLVKGKEAEGAKYSDYFDAASPLRSISSHRFLAMRRGEDEGILRISIDADTERITEALCRRFIRPGSATRTYMEAAVADSLKRLIRPSIETELLAAAKEKADDEAIGVFAENLRQLLLSAPLGQKRVIAIDPGFRTGCKVVVLDSQGNLVHNTTIYPHPPQGRYAEAAEMLRALAGKYRAEAFAIGDGTAGRETEQLVRGLGLDGAVEIFMVSEDGASVYSASAAAREEFPDYDVTVRGSVSIGRRLIDPLSELVKIDPKAIGVGQYQHDMPQKRLDETLGGVVEDCVNAVGVDVNTASASLLGRVAGLNGTTAKNIVKYREENGAFTTRRQLLKVPKVGPKAFQQCAGFLRVPESRNVLDHTGVHPESYPAAEHLLTLCGYTAADVGAAAMSQLPQKVRAMGEENAARQIGVGVPTLQDVVKELVKPGRDVRDDLPAPILRTDVLDIKDLKPGMELTGTVRNVVDFGVFVDIGVHQDGLVHISQICDRFIKHPSQAVAVGDVVKVVVLEVDEKKHRISLSMRQAAGKK